MGRTRLIVTMPGSLFNFFREMNFAWTEISQVTPIQLFGLVFYTLTSLKIQRTFSKSRDDLCVKPKEADEPKNCWQMSPNLP